MLDVYKSNQCKSVCARRCLFASYPVTRRGYNLVERKKLLQGISKPLICVLSKFSEYDKTNDYKPTKGIIREAPPLYSDYNNFEMDFTFQEGIIHRNDSWVRLQRYQWTYL